VTVFIEELAGIDSIPFQVYRSDTNVQIANEGSVMMRNGEVTISSNPFALVTLRSEAPVQIKFSQSLRRIHETFKVIQKGRSIFISSASQDILSAQVYSVSGKLVKSGKGKGNCSITMSNCARGAYILRVSNASRFQHICIQAVSSY
jgi:hypothetical protein